MSLRPTLAKGQATVVLAYTGNLKQQLEDETEHSAQCAGGPDFAEGVSAFIEKCNPRFNKA